MPGESAQRLARRPVVGTLDSKHPYGMTLLNDFGIGDSRVCHVGVNGVGPVGLGRRPGTTTDGFVVAESIVSEQQVIHGSLAGGRHAQRAQQDIDYALRRFHVSAHDGSTILGPFAPRRIQ